MDNFKVIYRLLRTLETAMDAEGVAMTRANDGYTAVSLSSPRITLRGLEYLEENSLMRKAAALAKGIAEVL